MVKYVKPVRDNLLNPPTNAIAIKRGENWWQFGGRAPALRAAIADLSEVLVIARVSKTVMPQRLPNRYVVSDSCNVFALDGFAVQAVLSSSLHQLWAITYGSGMRNDPRYTPSDVFETFPLPEDTDLLDQVGRELDLSRRAIMLESGLGLTALYNRVNDPQDKGDVGIERLRDLHRRLDEAVMDAHGWNERALGHGFHTFRDMRRWTVSPSARTEILDLLLEENHRRSDRGQG